MVPLARRAIFVDCHCPHSSSSVSLSKDCSVAVDDSSQKKSSSPEQGDEHEAQHGRERGAIRHADQAADDRGQRRGEDLFAAEICERLFLPNLHHHHRHRLQDKKHPAGWEAHQAAGGEET